MDSVVLIDFMAFLSNMYEPRNIQYLKCFMGIEAERLKDLKDYGFLYYAG